MGHDVLLVEDDVTLAEVVSTYLRRDGHTVRHAADGPTALVLANQRRPELVILDVMLPGLDGREVCRRLRAEDHDRARLPIIMLTALGAEEDRINGFELGVDDYVTKPFSVRELLLRVRAVLRRPGVADEDALPVRLTDADLELDTAAREATMAGAELALTSREFDLLAYLMAHPRTAFTRRELLERVWHWSHGDESTVTVHVRRLREKVEPEPANPRRLVTVWRHGYRWEPLP